jgi:hypothetical protein
MRRMASQISSTFALLLAAVLTAGCGDSTDSSAPTDEQTNALSAASGIDYAWSHPPVSSVRAAGYTFAARYLSYDTTGKNLSAAEARALWADGVDVVVVWEQTADASLDGYAQGVSDASAANGQANADGIPAGRPIYFAVDFDATPGDQAAINSYFDGVASVIGRARTGVYGGYYVVSRSFDAGKVAWGWQTYAWSGGLWDSRAQLRQVQNAISVGGVADCCDRDQGAATDFGQWHAQTVGTDGCTALEDHDASVFGCFCVDHQGNGGACSGTGCTATETHDAAEFGCGCVDHQANGDYCNGTGCTPKETDDAAKFGCSCVDHAASGGFCTGTGCTPKETDDAAKFGCGCVDHKASGGFCPGTGCTDKEINDCSAHGKTCSLHQCS